MKKILFGGASAALSVIGLSAFKAAKTTATTYYWLFVISRVPLGEVVLTDTVSALLVTVNGGLYSGSALTTLLFATAATTENNSIFSVCTGGSTYCLAGFNSVTPFSVVTSTYFDHLSRTISSPSKLGSQP